MFARQICDSELLLSSLCRSTQFRPRWFHNVALRHGCEAGPITQEVADLLEQAVFDKIPEDLPGRLLASDFEQTTHCSVAETPLLKSHGDGLAVNFGSQRSISVELLEMAASDTDGYYRRCVSVPLCSAPPSDHAVRALLEQICSSYCWRGV